MKYYSEFDLPSTFPSATGMIVPDLQVRQSFSGSECLAAFQHALDAVNTLGEGEWTADDGEEEAK